MAAIKSGVKHWGDRLEHLLRHAFLAMLQLPGATLQDVATLLRKSNESKRLRNRILDVVSTPSERGFWMDEFPYYTASELGPPKNKLSKILLMGPVATMLSQPTNSFSFREAMDTGQVILFNLAGLAEEVQRFIGCAMIALIRMAALSRSKVDPEKRRVFHVHCDEAHLFTTDSLEKLISDTRKYSVGLTLAHQYRGQMGSVRNAALGTVGTTIVFSVDADDAAALAKNMRQTVTSNQLIGLKKYQAIVRSDTDIVQIDTLEPTKLVQKSTRLRILAESHRQYCTPASTIASMITHTRNPAASAPLPHSTGGTDTTELVFDQFP